MSKGLYIKIGQHSKKSIRIANRNFSIEYYEINGSVPEDTKGDRFFIYTIISGEAAINYSGKKTKLSAGETVFIPTGLGEFSISGIFQP